MSRVVPAIAAFLAAAIAVGIAGADAWRTAATHGWVDDGLLVLVRDAFLHRFDRVAPVALGVLAALLVGGALVRRRRPPLADLVVPAVVVGVLVAARAAVPVYDATRPRRPNVLLVSIDTLRSDRVGAYGYGRPTTPVVDARLAAGGVVFENAWSQSPKTTPSHMTMLTSLYPAVHGVALWETGAASTLNPRVDTLAEALKNAGYDTFAVTAGAHMHRDRGFGQGFDKFQHGRQLERALAFLRGSHRRPFFLFFHTYEVHDPYAPPPDVARAFAAEPVPAIAAAVDEIRAGTRGWSQAHKRFWAAVDGGDPRHVRYLSDLYDAGIRHMDDRTLTQLLDALDAEGLADDTLVVFTSDHGEAFREHGRFLHDDLYPETLRVPLVVRLPHRLPAGRRVADAVGLVDLVPTVLDLLALPPLPQAQGTSLAGLARGDAGATAPPAVLADYSTAAHRFESIRRGGLALVVEGPATTVFDDAADPGEHSPMAPASRPEAAALGAELDRWHAANAELATRLGPRAGDVAAPSAETVKQLRALGYVE